MGTSAHLLALLCARTALAPEVRDRFNIVPGDFPDSVDRALFRALTEAESVGPAGQLGADVERRRAQLARIELPELLEGEEALEQAVLDCVRALRLEGLESLRVELRARLAGAGHHRQGDTPALVQELEALDRKILALRTGAAMEV